MIHWNMVEYTKCTFMTTGSTPAYLHILDEIERMHIDHKVVSAEVT